MRNYVALLMFVFVALSIVINSKVYSSNITVEITSPSKKARFNNCEDIVITANANVQDGEIRRVYFYQNGESIKSDPSVPYEITWENVPSGIYEISARAIDRNGNEAVSDSVLIFVGNVKDGDMIINGEFNCSTWPWRLDAYEGAQATFNLASDAFLTDDTSALYIEIQEIGNYVWGVQLMQEFKLQSGHTYEVSFVAEVYEDKDIQITFSQDYDPWAPHWVQDVTLSDYNIYGPYTYECNIDDPQVMFKFVIGGNLIPMTLDAVEVIDKHWTNIEVDKERQVQHYQLFQNYPNPFNPETKITYAIGKSDKIILSIYDVLGNNIISFTDEKSAGTHQIYWDGRDNQGYPVQSGVYVYKLDTGDFSLSRKMILVK